MKIVTRYFGAKWHPVFALLSIHVGLLAWVGYRNSPAWDEVAHLPAGLCIWKTGQFNVYSVNPPLIKTVAAIPSLFVSHEWNWRFYSTISIDRREFALGSDFILANSDHFFFLFTLARWACIPFSLLGAYICFLWAKELYGIAAGIVALLAWCFSPMVLGFGSLITPDVGSAALGITATYAFWHWLKKNSWKQTWIVGLLLGLAELTKFTLILFYALWPLIWVMWYILSRKNPSVVTLKMQSLQLATIFAVSVLVINMGYTFDGSLTPMKSYHFVSKTFCGTNEEGKIISSNRFRDTWLGEIPVPLPKQYICGIDVQKRDFEGKMPSYLRGEWKDDGWYHYYIYGLLIKEPLGTWGLIFLAVFVGFFQKGYASACRDEIMLLFPLLGLLLFVSSQNGFSHHIRYVLPIFPFAFIWMSKVAKSFEMNHRVMKILVSMCLIWSVGSSLHYYPHSMSYFNELVGGPKNGHYHLGNSNTDWGQDLLYLKRWLEKHSEVTLDTIGYDMPLTDTSLVGIHTKKYPPRFPEPGWHAISVNQIHNRGGEYEYFLKFKPYDMIGYSIYIYNITPDEANRVRREMGLPDWEPPQIKENEKEVVP